MQSKVFRIMPRDSGTHRDVTMHEICQQEAIGSFEHAAFPVIGGIAFVIEVMQCDYTLGSGNECRGQGEIKSGKKTIRLHDPVVALTNQSSYCSYRSDEIELAGN